MPTTGVQPPRTARKKAPKHIALPPAPSLDTSGEVPFTHIYPATPATRTSLSPNSEQRTRPNGFFILDQESPPTPTQPLSPPPATKHARRLTLPAQISLQHALGDPRSKRDPDHDVHDHSECPPTNGPEATSPVFSRCFSRCSVVSETRSQPSLSTKSKSKKTRPRAKTILSESGIRWSLDTPSFRSPGSMLASPETPREMSISEVPVMMSGELGRAIDIFGLAALQPPKIQIRPRPRGRLVDVEGQSFETFNEKH